MKKTVSNEEIISFLNSVSIMSAATVTPEGPLSSILLFTVEDDFTFYFSTSKSSRKARALSSNPHISLSVWEFEKMLVQAQGIASPVVDVKEIDKIFDTLAGAVGRMKNFWPPVIHIEGDGYIIYKISVTQMSVLPLSEMTMHNHNSSFINVPLPL